jgi:phosphopantothenoylcysteine decarboxylase/phosphopantothenate--cysteine ligase
VCRLKILITSGPTREYIDSVRFLSNASTGRMGAALAKAALRRGHQVVMVSGPTSVAPPKGVRLIEVITAAEMLTAARREFRRCDAAIFAAAVSDYRPRTRNPHKLAKGKLRNVLPLVPTVDVAARLGRSKGNRVTIGFALEDRAGRGRAARKLVEKRLDAIVLNHPESIGSDKSRVSVLVHRDGWILMPEARKDRVAAQIIRLLERISQRADGER